jgi:hypothetical protein
VPDISGVFFRNHTKVALRLAFGGGFLLAGRFQFSKSENQVTGPTQGIDIFVASLDRDSMFIKIDR